MSRIPLAVLLATGLAAVPALAQTQPDAAAPAAEADAEPAAIESLSATATMINAEGAEAGTLTLTETNSGVLVTGDLTGLAPGVHGFHFHETGECEPPFESAGGHFNPSNAAHGFKVEGGPHVGDMPNITVPESGEVTVEVLAHFASLGPDSGNTLLDDDGTAVMVHSGADDYASQPSGDAGDRVACGVVQGS